MDKIAIPTWDGRVSPVFDTASRLLVVELEDKKECNRFETDINEHYFPGKILRLTGLDIKILICGAISRPFANMMVSAGINLIPWISGRTEDVLQAFLNDTLFEMKFMMPGCTGNRVSGHGKGEGRGRRRDFNFHVI